MGSGTVRWGGLAGMLGGLTFVAEAIVFATKPGVALQDALLLAALFLVAGGLAGFHIFQGERAGRLGLAGFWLAIAATAAQAVAVVTVLVGGPSLDLLHGVGFLVLIVGYILYGVASLRAGVVPRWAAVALIVVGPASLPTEYSTAVLGVVWLALGYALWSRGDVALTRQIGVG